MIIIYSCSKYSSCSNDLNKLEKLFITLRPLTDVLWYGAVRPYVALVHDPCGQDIARTIWPRMLKLSMYTSYGQRKRPIYFQGQRSNYKVTGPLQTITALDPCGQDIARTMQSRLLKLRCPTSRERSLSFQGKGQISRSVDLHQNSNLVCTRYWKKPIKFQCQRILTLWTYSV